MKVLVLGGTGTVGSQVVNQLLSNNVQVRVLTSSAEKAAKITNGAEAVVGNLSDKNTLSEAFKGVDGLFLLNAVAENETEQGLNAVEMAKANNIKKIVYLSVFDLEKGSNIPHFATKAPIEQAIKDTKIPYVILRPNNFYQNDYWFFEVIKGYKMYPQPIGSLGMTRVDVRDIADAAKNAFASSEFDNDTYPMNGPDKLNAEKTCEIYSQKLGHAINYMGSDLVAWAEANKPYLPQWMIHDFSIMYKYFQEHEFNASPAEMEKQLKIVGHAPRTFEAFVDEILPMIKG